MLPSFLVPFKHYKEETISGALDGIVHSDDADTDECPSERTIGRWKHWLMANESFINGNMKSIAFRELDFSEELLKSNVSLLEKLRRSIPDGWLETVIRFLYNSGSFLQAFY